jgi:hypothetical protein
MLNWDFFKPRNFVVIGAIAVTAFCIFKHFSKGSE